MLEAGDMQHLERKGIPSWLKPLAITAAFIGLIWYLLSGIPTNYEQERISSLSDDEYNEVVESVGKNHL